MLENVKYGIYPWDAEFNDLPIGYEQRLFTKKQTDRLNDNIVEKFKVILTKIVFDNRIYESNPQNYDFDDLPFDDDEMLIPRWQIYRINDDILFKLNIGPGVDV